MYIRIEVNGLEEALAKINQLKQTKFQSDLVTLLASAIQLQTVRRFDSKTAPGGAAWAPRKKKYAHGLLTKGGTLKGSFEVNAINALSARVETNIAYAPFHQFGTSRMVARPFLGVDKANEAELLNVARVFISSELGI